MKILASYHQERLWFIDKFETGFLYESSPTYHNIPLVLNIQGHLDLELLTRSIQDVINRHEALRSKIVTINEKPVQVISSHIDFQLTYVDCGDANSVKAIVLEKALEDSGRPFILEEDSLIRASLYQFNQEEAILVITLHHIIADKPSLSIIAGEIFDFYQSYLDNTPVSLPELDYHYADFSEWQRNLPDEEINSLRYYWSRNLEGKLQALELPTDRPRVSIHIYSAGVEKFTLPESALIKIKDLASSQATTAEAILLGVFKVLLYKYSGLEEIVVGTSNANRAQPGMERVVGPIANLLVLRNFLDGKNSFLEVLGKVHETLTNALKNQEMPFDKLVLELNPDKDMSRTALFDVLFQFEKLQSISVSKLKVSEIEANLGWGKYDLNLLIREEEDSMLGVLTFNKEYYNQDTIQRFTAHYLNLLDEILANPLQEISQINFLSPQEQHQLLVEYNQTQADYPAFDTIHSLFEKQVLANPKKQAVVYGERSLTYEQLNNLANQLAEHLRQHSGGKNDFVGIMLQRSEMLVAGILGIVKSGGAYVPIDPEYPEERINYILSDSNCNIIVTTASLKSKIDKAFKGHIIEIDHLDSSSSAPVFANPSISCKPEDVAYMIYTSGTTGRPKGCMVTHKNLVRLFKNDHIPFDFSENDVWVMAHSFCFDFSVWEMYGALLYGGKLVVPDLTNIRDTGAFHEFVKAHGVTVLNQTPLAFYNFIEAEKTDTDHQLNKHLRYVIFGGDKLEPSYLKEWVGYYPLDQIRLVNMYGITETTVHVTYYDLKDEDVNSPDPVSIIGLPLPETTLYIFDRHLQLTPHNVPGEMYVGGTGVCKGYWNKDALTSERFIQNPYRLEETLYKTGDIGKRRYDGNIEYLGRADDQVKIRGFRIELGEIENVLIKHDKIIKATAVAKKIDGDQCLIGYFTSTEPLAISDLRLFLKSFLPEYMVPAFLVQLDSFPLTSNGKIDRKSLPDPIHSKSFETEYAAPENQMEEELVSIWTKVLAKNKIGVTDNFFEIGGHSLKATQVISRIHKHFDVKIELKNIFTHPTIRELAGVIAEAKQTTHQSITPIAEQAYYEVSHAQKRLWILAQYDKEQIAYNMFDSYEFKGELDKNAFEKAFETLVQRHEILRTTFVTIEGEPKQKVHPFEAFNFKIELIDLRNEEAPDLLAKDLAYQEVKTSFDLEKGPLLRARLLQIEDKHYVFLLAMHHIISDGWSMEVLVKEVLGLYHHYHRVEDIALPPLKIQYKDYSAWQNKQLEGDQLLKYQGYWMNKLGGSLPVLEFPSDYTRPAIKTYNGNTLSFKLDRESARALSELSLSKGTSLFVTVLAAIKALLYRYTGQQDIILGFPSTGRSHLDLEDQIGFYINMLAIRTQFDGNQSFGQLLSEVNKNTLEAFEFQDYPFDRLMDELNIERDLSRLGLYDIGLTWHAAAEANESPSFNFEVQKFPIDFSVAKADLWFHGSAVEGEVFFSVEYNTDLFKKERIERFIHHFQGIVKAIADNSESALDSLDYLPSEEKNRLLFDFNETKLPFSAGKTIAKLFEEKVLEMPDATAIVFEDKKLTYAQLNEEANRLAHHLRSEYRIQPEDMIGLMVNKSETMIIALLGILKSGGAYVPIDTQYPQERIEFILDDAQVRLLITDSDHLFNVGAFSGNLFAIDLQLSGLEDKIENPEIVNTPDDLAYIIYTSGSTGKPKGVMIEHHSLTNHVEGIKAICNIRNKWNCAFTSSIAFDASIKQIFVPLISGGEVHIIREVREVQHLTRYIIDHKINVVNGVPSLMKVLLTENEMLQNTSHIECILVGGEKLDYKLANQIREKYPQSSFINLYGPTETCVNALYFKIEEEQITHPPLGKGFPNYDIYLLDQHQNLVPVGVTGEISVSGEGVARGYLNREQQTSEKFIPNPFKTGQRIYKTGDIGRWTEDGNVEFLGRNDSQVKIKGYRIELGEIERTILAHEEVEQCVVIPRSVNDDHELVAYIKQKDRVKLRPSWAEYFVYDDMAYYTMTRDEERNEKYRNAINNKVKDKVVLEIGPGSEVILSRFCVEAGAKKVYAVEILEEAYLKAKQKVELLGLQDKIILIHGDVTKVSLPEKIDCCVSEIVGSIGGSQGASLIMNHVRDFLKDPQQVIPLRSISRIAAIDLPSSHIELGFDDLGKHYVDKIFEQVGEPFDLRICLQNFKADRLISNDDVFEYLDYSLFNEAEGAHNIHLEIERDGLMHGFVVWLDLYLDEKEVLQTLGKDSLWLPLYFPVFEDGQKVSKGDYINARIIKKLARNGVNPDFELVGSLYNGEERISFAYRSNSYGPGYKSNAFYDKLFSSELKPVEKLSEDDLKDHLSRFLPSYMVPAYYVTLEKFALTPHGKIDLKALPIPAELQSNEKSYIAPRNPLEIQLAAIWQDKLGKEKIGVNDNFFALGGDSIKAIRVVSTISKELGKAIEVKDIFAHQSIAALAEYIAAQHEDLLSDSIALARLEIDKIKESILNDRQQRKHLPEDWEDLYPMSDIEKGMIFHNLLDATTGVYQDQSFFQIEDDTFDFELFKKAFGLLTEKHAILRTSFNITNFSEPIQIVHQYSEKHLDVLFEDLSGLNQAQQKEYLETFLKEDKKQSFHLSKVGLWRIRVFALAPNEYGILWSVHHAIIDGWSNASLITELSNVYFTLKTYETYRPAPVKASYKDFIIEQHNYRNQEEVRNFWQVELSDYNRVSLPLHKTIDKGFEGKDVESRLFVLEPALSKSLHATAEKMNVGIKDVILSGFIYLIKMVTNMDDITVGLVTNGRPAIEDGDKVIGCFVNSVPFRINLKDRTTGAGLIKAVSNKNHKLKSYDKISLQEILRIIGEETTEQNPIFDILLNFVDFHIYDETHDDTKVKQSLVQGFENSNTNFDIIVKKMGENLAIGICHRVQLYNEEEVLRIWNYFKTILEHLAYNAGEDLSPTSILSIEERNKLLFEFNNTSTDFPAAKTIQELFEERVEKAPKDVAVVYGRQHMTYEELNIEANNLASYLRSEYKIQPDDTIGLMIERSETMIIGIMGILKSGAAYVPIDPSYPKPRIEHILSDSNVKVLLTTSDLIFEVVDSYKGELFALDLQLTSLPSQSENPFVTNTPKHLAYIIYTSGTTGNPKGVAVEHSSVIRLVKDTNYTSIQPTDQIIQLSNYVFDGSVFDIFGALLNGATLHVISKETLLSSENLVSYIKTNNINTMFITTALFNNIVELTPDCIKSFDKLYFGGEVASLRHIRKALDNRKNKDSIVHVYGPTEGTTFSTYYIIEDLEEKSISVPIGKPLSNTTVYILDSHMDLVPLGIYGEVYIGGEGLAREYWHAEKLTSEKFVINPFVKGGKERLYKTGDLGRFLPDGNIDFAGRKDTQIKIRGFRIELGEIENTLLKHPEVAKALVIAREDKTGEKQLVAYYVSKQESAIDNLKDHLKASLPEYMIPGYFIPLSSFPLNISGKVNRKELPDPEGMEMEGRAAYIPPKNDVEKSLVRIWEEILGKSPIGVEDNFFEIGGHSLKVIQLVSSIQKELNVKVELRNIFTTPTITELAEIIKESVRVEYDPIEPAAVQEHYELSHSQKRLWIACQHNAAQLAYSLPRAYIFEGELDIEAFAKAFKSMVTRHETLRTTFVLADGEPRQKIHPEDWNGFKFEYHEPSSAADGLEFIRQLVEEESELPFDFEKGPLLRTKLIKLEDARYLFLFTMHHIISDEWSMEVLVREILVLYNAFKDGKVNPLPALAIQYKDYATWQNMQLQKEDANGLREYWLGKFSQKVQPLQLPVDYPRPTKRSYLGKTTWILIEDHLTKALEDLSVQNNASVFMIILTALKALLYKYTDQEDIVIGSPAAGRDHGDVENQIGFFVNMLALRTQFTGSDTLQNLLLKVRETTLGAYDHQLYPFDCLVEDLDYTKDDSRGVLYDVGLTWHAEATAEETTAVDFTVETYETDYCSAISDLWIHGNKIGNQIVLTAVYSKDLFEEETIVLMLQRFKIMLQLMVENSLVPLNELELELEIEKELKSDSVSVEFNFE